MAVSTGEAWAEGFVPGACPELIERDDELQFLNGTAAAAATGRARLVLLSGEAGAGKTRLTAEFAAGLSGWQVLSASAILVETPEVPAGTDPARALAEQMTERIRAHAEASPVLLVAEDVHSFDPVSIAALGHAFAPLADSQVLLVATFRLGTHSPGDAHARAVVDLLRHPGAAELRLAPLSRSGVDAMARAMRGPAAGGDESFLAALHERTGGNPFFTEELLRSGSREVPWTVAETVAGRLAQVGGAARRVVAALAAAESPLPARVLATAAGCTTAELEPVVGAGLVVTAGPRLRLRHALVGEAVLAQLAADEHETVHRAAAVALATWPDAPADRVACLWWAGGAAEEARPWAERAARAFVARRAYRSATEMYDIVLARTTGEDPDAADLFERAAVAAAIAGDAERARRWAVAAEVAFRASDQSWRAASMWLNPALHYLPKPAVQAGELEHTSVWRLVMDADEATGRGDPDAGAALAVEAVARARAASDADGRAAAAVALVHAGAVAAGTAELQAMRDEALRDTDELAFANVVADQSRVALAMGEVARAISLDHEALAAARRADEASVWPRVQLGLGLLLAIAGEVDEAEVLIAELYDLGLPMLDIFLGIPMAVVALERGDIAAAAERIRPAMPFAQAASANILLPASTVLAQVEMAAGDAAACARTLADARQRVPAVLVEETTPDRLLLTVRAGVALGDTAGAEDAAGELAALARSGMGPGVLAAADAASALVAAAAGDHRQARTRFAAAARLWERAPRWALAAEAWADAAAAAQAVGEHTAAADATERGVALTERFGLGRIAARFGAPVPAGAAAVPEEFEDLTERELEVVRLVAAGCTNREIGARLHISDKTARNHLSAIFAKLGVRRRSELAALAANFRNFLSG